MRSGIHDSISNDVERKMLRTSQQGPGSVRDLSAPHLNISSTKQFFRDHQGEINLYHSPQERSAIHSKHAEEGQVKRVFAVDKQINHHANCRYPPVPLKGPLKTCLFAVVNEMWIT